MPTTSRSLIIPSTSAPLSRALEGLHASLISAAETSVTETLEASGQSVSAYTSLERRAMIKIEALKLVNGLDLAAIIERGRLLHEIEEEGLVGVHPGHYSTLEEMARDQGISISELSDVRALVDIIFPWIEEHLEISVAQLWASIGKSGFRQLTPVLRGLITGDETGARSTRESVTMILDSIAATAASQGEENLPAEEITQRAVQYVLDVGINSPTREITRRLRPNHTPDIATLFIQDGETTYTLMKMNSDQRTMFLRLANNHLNASLVDAGGRAPYIAMLSNIFGESE